MQWSTGINATRWYMLPLIFWRPRRGREFYATKSCTLKKYIYLKMLIVGKYTSYHLNHFKYTVEGF